MSAPSGNGSSGADQTASGAGGESPKRPTLRPPEWTGPPRGPVSVASLTLAMQSSESPVSRRTGPRAELAHLRARLAAVTAAGDTEGERQAATELARALVTRGTELDAATKLARRALLVGHDPQLREELAGWFAALGESALAAATLRPLVADLGGSAAARVLTRIGVLLGRAGEPAAAADALFDAAREDPSDPIAPELQAAIGAWAPSAVSRERAAEGYLEGYRRREASGDRAGAFEDVLRAFEVAPAEPLPAERLAGALATRGRNTAADEVLREHARASGERARAVHLRRLRDAVAADDIPRALGAALDARLEAETDFSDVGPAIGTTLGEILAKAGLHELWAAVLEHSAQHGSDSARAALHAERAQLYASVLASPERALEAWADTLVADPDHERARAALSEELAQTGDASHWVGALLRVATGSGAASTRRSALAELARLAAERLNEPGLCVWAVQLAKDLSPDSQLSALGADHATAARYQEEQIRGLQRRLEATSDSGRVEPLRELTVLLRGRPDFAGDRIAALRELTDRAPDDRGAQRALERVLSRDGRWDELEAALRRALARAAGGEQDRIRLSLSALCRRRGDARAALDVLEPLVTDSAPHLAVWSHAAVLAARLDDERMRAHALLGLSGSLSAPMRAVVACVAAESLLAAGAVDEARAAAEQASRSDPTQARPVGVLAAIALQQSPDRDVAAALERAMGFVVPRAALCEAIAVAHEALGDASLALVWTQRWLTLRPGDPRAIRTLLGRVTESGDAQRISDALSWLLSQPQPFSELSSPLAAALLRLSELDTSLGVAMARRALDVLGPRSTELRNAVVAVADAAQEHGLAIAVLERQLAVGGGADAVDLLLELAARRRMAGDADGAAREIARAATAGATPTRVLQLLSDALPARSSDGDLALLTARAVALARFADGDREAAARAFRELGAARWDLAGDSEGAVAAWEQAALLDPVGGVARLARDLSSFAGSGAALRHLDSFAARQSDPRDSARVLAVAAAVALGAGESEAALRVAARALDLDPSQADVLAVAERAAGDDDKDALDAIYDKLARAALGRYGERAAHYRAARQFERRGDVERALRHAVSAFEAVPAAGVTYVMMSRLADRADRPASVVRALERVAESAKQPDERAEWLRRAAILGGRDEESTRLRVDVLLRAVVVRPDAGLIEALGKAVADLAAFGDENREIAHLRFENGLQALLPRLEGPEGARIGIAASRVAAEVGLTTLALTALEKAIGADADVDEFVQLAARATELAKESGARALTERVLAMSAERYANVGRALLELAAVVARALGDAKLSGRLMVAAAERDPDDPELARRAALAAELAGDSELLGRVAQAVPTSERIGGLMAMAADAEKSGDLSLAADALERVVADDAAKPDDKKRARVRLRELYAQIGDQKKLEQVLTDELAAGELSGGARVRAARDLASLIAARGDVSSALELLGEETRRSPPDVALLEDVASLAARAGDTRRRAAALSTLVDLVGQREKLRILRELAPLLELSGDDAGAMARWRQINALAPNELDAIAALERAALKQGDYEQAAGLMARRAGLASQVSEVRQIRLQRAELLERRLGRADEARAELEAVLAATGDHLEVLRVLADLHERLGAPLRAAPLWMRASAATQDRDEATPLALRACEAYLAGADLDGARRVLDGMEAWVQSVDLSALRVEIERRGGDPRALAVALEELAAEVASDTERHVALLVEAAYAHDAAGDHEDALAAADRAAQLSPAGAEPQLLSAWLEYRVKGPTTREHARVVVTALRAITGPLTPVQAELRSFLVAEALDVAVGTGAGMRELTKAHAERGLAPLIALGIAERLVEGGEPAQSLPMFDLALAGDLRELRSRGRVALSAVDAARAANDPERAMSYAEIAAADPNTRKAATALQTQIRAEIIALEMARERAASRREGAAAISAPREEAPESLAGPRDSEPPAQGPVARITEPEVQAAESPLGISEHSLPIPQAPDEVPASLPGPRDSERPAASAAGPSTVKSTPGVETRYRSSAPTERFEALTPTPVSASSAPRVAIRSAPPGPAASGPREVALPSVDMPPSLRRISGTFAVANPREAELFQNLSAGSLDAGLELTRQLENRRDRTHDLVAVCRRVVAMRPGDRDVLSKLYEAALSDKNHAYARAVEHVLAMFDPSIAPVAAPPLADQPEDPERVRPLLFRGVLGSVAEALALVWEGASHVFRRDMSSYGVTGVDRVPHGSATPLGRSCPAAGRVLGLSRTPVFELRSFGAISMSVALLTPPAVVVSGEVTRETPELMFHLGAMLVATLPEHVLLTGSSEEQARDIIKGMLLAFGPPEQHKAELASAASLAEVLWERIPARAQRRLREICHEPDGIDFETAVAGAWRALRRAGLFVSGDLPATLRETCRQLGLPVADVGSPAALAELCRTNADVADLVTLATSSELAAARWYSGRGNRPGGSG